MRAKSGNSGKDIRNKYPDEIRFNTTRKFYDQHPIRYWDARYRFYKNNNLPMYEYFFGK